MTNTVSAVGGCRLFGWDRLFCVFLSVILRFRSFSENHLIVTIVLNVESGNWKAFRKGKGMRMKKQMCNN